MNKPTHQKVGRKLGTRVVVTDEQLALVVWLARRGASRAAIARGTGVSLRMVWYLIDQHCPKAASKSLPLAEVLESKNQ